MEDWTNHFEEVAGLLNYCERQHGIANAALSEHIIERLDLAVQSCTTIAHELANPSVSLTQEEQSTLDEFKASLGELLSCLRLLLEEWKDYIMRQHILVLHIRYQFYILGDEADLGLKSTRSS